MRANSPPRFAAWLLEHCAPGCDPSLRGDLLEELHRGRNTGWYWRQVIGVLAIALCRDLPVRLLDVLFAIAWCALTPGWMQIVAILEIRFDLATHLRQIPFPYSNLLTLALGLMTQLAFIWWGLALYLVVRTLLSRHAKVRRVLRGLLWSVQMFLVATVAIGAILLLFPRLGDSNSAMTLLGQISHSSAAAWIRRVPYVLTFLCALWLLSYRSPGYRERKVS